jgi:hypothetical protein
VFARRDHPAASNALNSSAPLAIALTLSPRRPRLGRPTHATNPNKALPRTRPGRNVTTSRTDTLAPREGRRQLGTDAGRLQETVISSPTAASFAVDSVRICRGAPSSAVCR